jgi:hypothetical protein
MACAHDKEGMTVFLLCLRETVRHVHTELDKDKEKSSRSGRSKFELRWDELMRSTRSGKGCSKETRPE